MNEWRNRPLDEVYPATFIGAIRVVAAALLLTASATNSVHMCSAIDQPRTLCGRTSSRPNSVWWAHFLGLDVCVLAHDRCSRVRYAAAFSGIESQSDPTPCPFGVVVLVHPVAQSPGADAECGGSIPDGIGRVDHLTARLAFELLGETPRAAVMLIPDFQKTPSLRRPTVRELRSRSALLTRPATGTR